MKTTDQAQAALPMDACPSQIVSGRGKSHLLAYGFFAAGASCSWFSTGKAFALDEALCLLAIAWFPAVIVEVFRRFPLENPAWAAAMLSGIAGYDGVMRLLKPWAGVGC